MEQAFTKRPHAVVLVSPGMGHLTPTVELVKLLVSHHGFEVTLFAIIAESSSVQSQILSSTCTIPNKNFLHVQVLEVDVSSLVPPDADMVYKLVVTMANAIPLVRSAIGDMKVCPDLFIADLFGTDYWDVADEFNMSKFMFMTTSAWFLATTVYLPPFEKEVSKEELEGLEYIQMPGCRQVTRSDFIGIFNRDGPEYLWFVGVAKKIAICAGIIVNSWNELEPKTIESLNDKNLLGKAINGKVYPIGPLVKKPSTFGDSDKVALHETNEVLKWMDKQPDQSILYVSFGSGGSLTYEQIQELAWGLEFSQQRFIWVLRPPLDKDASEFFFSVDIGNDASLAYLPAGFLTRTKDIGLVVPMWAPQAEILGHKALGGFLTHCGFNSILESIVNGVPMLAWPLYAEQEMNATMLTEELKIAVRPQVTLSTKEVKVIGREEIEKAIRKIMVEKGSNVIRDRVKKLQKSALEAGDPTKGPSYNSLIEFTKLCMTKMKGK